MLVGLCSQELVNMGKNQWANQTKKKMDRNSDAKALDLIQTHLEMLQDKPINVIREKIYHEEEFTTRNKNHEADLVLNDFVILHHDTIHTHNELAYPNKKTLQRDMDFERAKIPYIIINADLAKNCNLNEADLAEYLYYHELHKMKVRDAVYAI